MKFILRIGFYIVAIGMPLLSFSQQNDSTATAISSLRRWVKFDGVIKTKLETSTDSGTMRFNVRNSRLGLRGDIGEYISYRVQVEFSNEGTFSPLDLYGTLKPAKGLSINIGQTSIPFDNQYIISPAEMMFSNRAFVGKYFTPGSRDIGAVLRYKFPLSAFPLEGEAGIFNGGKINNPEWTDRPSFALRLIAGSMDGFRASAKLYHYKSETLDMKLWGADVRYANNRFLAEAEVMNRESEPYKHDLFGTYVQGGYNFDFRNPKMFHGVTPVLRWDAMGHEVFDSGFDVNRLTFGLNFGMALSPFKSVLRIDYEHYFLRDDLFPEFDGRDTHVADNKITLELVLKF